MFNRLWQRVMIRLARSKRLSTLIQDRLPLHGLSRRFVGGRDQDDVLQCARQLHEDGLQTSVYYLGEYVSDATLIEENVRQVLQVIEAFGAAGQEIHVSVDPTQIGYTVSDDLGWQNALRLGRALVSQPTAKFLMIDMEDYSYLEKTLSLYCRLRDEQLPVAVTLQAYLYRTADDLYRITQQPAAIRLVKGAFAESSQIAWSKKVAVNANYRHLTETLLQPTMRERGVYPIFATHDDHMIDKIKHLLKTNSWQPGQYEFEMLLGVRTPLQRQLVAEGYPVRLYVPFGTAWWAYTARRIGENPANLGFVLRALVSR